VNTTFGPPEPAPDLRQGIEAPPYALGYGRSPKDG
jgi:hypothetical protein